MIKNRSANTTIPDGSITEAKLDAGLTAKVNAVGGGGLTENSVNSSHIINGSILGTDISGATIQGSNIAVGTITSSNILDGTILGTDISGATIQGSNIANGAIVRSKLSELTTNLLIYNSDTSTTTLSYTIILNDGGTLSTYFTNLGGIGIGMSHSVRVCVPNINTEIKVEVDTDNKQVSNSAVGTGAIQVGIYQDNTLSFTLDPNGYDNIQIGFAIDPDV